MADPAIWREVIVDDTPGHETSRAVLYLLKDGAYVPTMNVTVSGVQFRDPVSGEWTTVIDTTSSKILIEADTTG